MQENWVTAVVAILGALGGGGIVAKVYKGGRAVKEDFDSDRLSAKFERRNDHTVEFAETAYREIIKDYAAQVALKNVELLNKDLEIARLKLLADKDDERKDNMVRRHYTGKDILKTDIEGTGAPKS